MTGLVNNFRIRNAQDFVDFVQSVDSSMYVFLGRTSEWPDEEIPPDVINTDGEIYQIWRDMNGIARVTAPDITIGLREILWESGKMYDQYADDVDLVGKDFYVLTDQFNVYKCISNNNNNPSTQRPTHVTFDIPLQTDGYKWKYMFSVTSSLLRKFIVPNFFPLNPSESVKANAIEGTIDTLRIDNAGNNYPVDRTVNSGNAIPVFIEGDGVQNQSALVSISTSPSGEIISPDLSDSIIDPGENYPNAPEQNIPVALRQFTTQGINQTAYGIASTDPNGEIVSVQVIINGTGYNPSLDTHVVQSSCRAFAETDANGQIINADVPTGRAGSGFTRAVSVVIVPPGTGTDAELKPIIAPLGGHGSDQSKELLGNFVLLNLRISGSDNFLGESNFRRVGLIENPSEFGILDSAGEPVLFTDLVGDTKFRLKLTSGDNSAFEGINEIIGETSGTRGVEVTTFGTDELRVTIDNQYRGDGEFIEGENIVSIGTEPITDAIDTITEPDVETNSGDILFINNRELVQTDNPQQIETITLVLEY